MVAVLSYIVSLLYQSLPTDCTTLGGEEDRSIKKSLYRVCLIAKFKV
jgi:hypothetical protein